MSTKSKLQYDDLCHKIFTTELNRIVRLPVFKLPLVLKSIVNGNGIAGVIELPSFSNFSCSLPDYACYAD